MKVSKSELKILLTAKLKEQYKALNEEERRLRKELSDLKDTFVLVVKDQPAKFLKKAIVGKECFNSYYNDDYTVDVTCSIPMPASMVRINKRLLEIRDEEREWDKRSNKLELAIVKAVIAARDVNLVDLDAFLNLILDSIE